MLAFEPAYTTDVRVQDETWTFCVIRREDGWRICIFSGSEWCGLPHRFEQPDQAMRVVSLIAEKPGAWPT